ncbi:MAG: phage shock protein C [Halioglobus sp.]|jgi:phage shock protein C
MTRRRDQHRHYSSKRHKFRSRKKSGWGMNLYRNTREGKISGVCAGLGDHWDIAHWVVRLMWVGAFLFTGPLAFWAYIGAWIMLAPNPHRRSEDTSSQYYEDGYVDANVEMEYDEYSHDYRPKKVFRYPDSNSERLLRARERLDGALRAVEGMESYVTSRQYNLNKEFSKL